MEKTIRSSQANDGTDSMRSSIDLWLSWVSRNILSHSSMQSRDFNARDWFVLCPILRIFRNKIFPVEWLTIDAAFIITSCSIFPRFSSVQPQKQRITRLSTSSLFTYRACWFICGDFGRSVWCTRMRDVDGNVENGCRCCFPGLFIFTFCSSLVLLRSE